jgi:inner membrane protein
MTAPVDLLFWHWWVAGLLLLALEAFFPGAVFLWMGVSALVTGTLSWLLPLPWQWELAVSSDQPTLNRRGDAYLGRRLTLSEAIVNGHGRVRMDDTQWRIAGPDLPSGTQVEVVAVDGATLRVKAT